MFALGAVSPLVVCATLGLAAACSSRPHCITETRGDRPRPLSHIRIKPRHFTSPGRLEEHKYVFDSKRTEERNYRVIIPKNTCPNRHTIIGLNVTTCSRHAPTAAAGETISSYVAEDWQTIVVSAYTSSEVYVTAYCARDS